MPCRACGTSVPIPKFAMLCGKLRCELRNQGTLAVYDSSAPYEPEVRNRTRSNWCANFGFGALATSPPPRAHENRPKPCGSSAILRARERQ